MKTYIKRLGILAGLAAMLVVATACNFRDDGGGTPAGRRSERAPIESVDIVVRESFPPQYGAQIVSGLPSGCAAFEKAEVSERSGNTITISVTNTMPSNPDTVCTAIYGMHESNVDLGSDFVSGETYRVDVNGTVKEFKAQ